MDTLYLVVAIGVLVYFIRSSWLSGDLYNLFEFCGYGLKVLAVMASAIYIGYVFLPKESATDRRVREMEEEMAATLKFLGIEAEDANNK
jgi:hypothetical protein